MDLGLKGKVALVTGGSKGIGKAVARGLLEEGAKVAICARTKSELDHASTELAKKTGGEVFSVADGSATNPLTDAALEEKFLGLAAPVLGEARAREGLAQLWRVDALPDIRPLAELLAG